MKRESDILISFIIPVYNAEKYLSKCLDSIIDSKSEKIEIVLVDDGSTDGSSSICDKYSDDYNFISVYHQNNSGVASARNLGLKKSIGKYVFFVDNDDWLDSNEINNTIIQLENKSIDLLFNKYYIHNNNKFSISNEFKDISIFQNSSDFILGYLINRRINIIAPWEYIVKRDILINNNIFFPDNCDGIDDSVFTPLVFCHCNSFACGKNPIYFWRQRLDSQGRNHDMDLYANKMINAINILKDNINVFSDKTKISYIYFSLYKSLFSLFGKYGMYSKETKKNLSRFIFDNKGVIKLASRNSGVYHRITNIVLGNFFGLLLSYNLARLKSYLLLRFSNK